MNAKDIPGIKRCIVGFNKIPDSDGEYLMAVQYDLKPIDLNILQKIFNIDMNSNDPGIIDMIDPLDINESEAKELQQYVINGHIDVKKYFFELHCYKAN